jgi:predicted alpha/beta superfamily hydrolase
LGVAAGLAASIPVNAQSTVGVVEARPYSLERSTIFDVEAPGGDSYAAMVAWPEGEAPASGWPVLYILDGEDNFAIFALTARRLARARERSGIEPGIVVGIAAGPLARRVRDYTPSVPGYRVPPGRPAAGLQTGGADAFLDMLETRLMPDVRRRWPVDTRRETLAGHSFGGLLAIHALLTRPAMVDQAVAVSPSFWFGDGLLTREAAAAAGTGPIHIFTGEKEQGATAAAEAFAAALRTKPEGGSPPPVELAGQSHGGTMLAAAAQTIAAAFGTTKP